MRRRAKVQQSVSQDIPEIMKPPAWCQGQMPGVSGSSSGAQIVGLDRSPAGNSGLPAMAISAAEVRETITRVAQRAWKPVVACSVEAGAALVPSGAAQVAEIPSPERTAAALAHVWRRTRSGACAAAACRGARRTVRPAGDQPDHRGQARQQPRGRLARARSGGRPGRRPAACLCCRRAVRRPRRRPPRRPRRSGSPWSSRPGSGDVVHKSDVGGVALGLAGPPRLSARRTRRCRCGSAHRWAVQ